MIGKWNLISMVFFGAFVALLIAKYLFGIAGADLPKDIMCLGVVLSRAAYLYEKSKTKAQTVG